MWPFYLLAFLSSAGIMTLELAAGRLVAPYLGVNLYTWTSVIGVILLGMSLGAFAGGWMADRWNPRRLLSEVLVIAGLATAGILAVLPVVVNNAVPRHLAPMLGILIPILLIFTLPAFCLALVSPIIFKVVIADLTRLGGTVGRLSAAGILGSIAGTFATGFWLVPNFGTRSIVLGVAAVMVLLGLAALPRGRSADRPRRATIRAHLAPGGILATVIDRPNEPFQGAQPFPLTVRTPDADTMLLTDDYVPKDPLLLPVFHDRWQRR